MCNEPGIWPCSHSSTSRTSTIAAGEAPSRTRSTSSGLISGIAARASRMRSETDLGFDMAVDGTPLDRRAALGRMAGRRRETEVDDAGLRPARYTCSGAVASCAFLRLVCGRGGGVELAQGVAKRVEAEHRALQPGGADLAPEELQEVGRPEVRDLLDGHALHLVG